MIWYTYIHSEKIPYMEFINPSFTSLIYLCVFVWEHLSSTLSKISITWYVVSNYSYQVTLDPQNLFVLQVKVYILYQSFPICPYKFDIFF